MKRYKNSIALFVLADIIGLFIFFIVWINIYIAPIYIIVHGFLIFGLLSLPNFKSTLKPVKFGIIICCVPLALLLLEDIFAIPLYISTGSNLGDILIPNFLTIIVSLVDFFTIYFIYFSWWQKKEAIKNEKQSLNI